MTIVTPATHPNHQTVGRHLIGPCFRCEAGKHVFYCDSYDPRIGFWLTRADCPPEHNADEGTDWRRNVSEHAIGGSFHRIWDDGPENGNPWSQWGVVDRNLLTIPIFTCPMQQTSI